MPVPYERKRQLLLEKRQKLVHALQKRISLRNVPDALKLPAQAQGTLAQALEQGVQKQRFAIQLLQRQPTTSVERLLVAIHGEGESMAILNDENSFLNSDESVSEGPKPPELKDASPLADLLIDYGLHENRMIAETVASAEYMGGVLDVVLALERVRKPQGAETETVTLALCAVAVWLIDEINTLLEEKYAHRMAVLQAKRLGWSQFMSEDSMSTPALGREDVLALSKMIKAGSGWGYAEAEQAAEGESLAELLSMAALYRHMREKSPDKSVLALAAWCGFAMRVVEDVLTFLSENPEQAFLLKVQSKWPEWFHHLLENAKVLSSLTHFDR